MKKITKKILVVVGVCFILAAGAGTVQADVPADQVLIETKVVTVHRDFEKGLGIDYTFRQKKDNGQRTLNVTIVPDAQGWTVLGSELQLQDSSAIAPASTQEIAVSQENSDGSVASALSVFGSKKADNNIISRPRVITAAGETAFITAGEAAVAASSRQEYPDDQKAQEAANLSLGDFALEPVIGQNADVVVAVRPAAVKTQVSVPDGQTVVLGGLREKFDLTSVPVLGDVPVINGLFKTKLRHRDQTEAIVVITPVLIKDGD